jgi:hypothetical protein
MKNSTKRFLKGSLIFLGGVALGALGAWALSTRKYETEIDGYLCKINDLSGDGNINDREPEEVVETQEQTTVMREHEEKVLILPRDRYKKVVRNLGYNKGDMPDPAEFESPRDDEDEEDYEYEQRRYEPNSSEKPYVISIDEYSEENTHYDKITLYFYEDDEVLTEDDEEAIDDPNALVGDYALNCFGENSGDPEVVYVRNERLQIDYEVIRLSKSYQETVLGIIGGSGDDE